MKKIKLFSFVSIALVSLAQPTWAGPHGGRGGVGDQTEDALARYEEDHDLSVTGTVTAAALQSLGLAQGANY